MKIIFFGQQRGPPEAQGPVPWHAPTPTAPTGRTGPSADKNCVYF